MRWFHRPAAPAPGATEGSQARIAEFEERCRDLSERLRVSEERLRERGELLYELERHYSSEHFSLQESMRGLKIERMRNAGAFADRDIILGRAKELQTRIRALKERLRRYESVDDLHFDDAPIVRENEKRGEDER